jgi:cytochrome c oxidase assembly factor CtaG
LPGYGIIVLAFLSVAYLVGYRRLRRLGRGTVIRLQHKIAFFIAVLSLLPVFGWPLAAVASDVFSVHILQHVILFCVTAPLLSRSRAMIGLLWALPAHSRGIAGAVWFSTIGVASRALLRRPIAGATLFGASFAFAQFSVLIEWTPHDLARTAAHVLYLGIGTAFWWTILAPNSYRTIAHARALRFLAILVLEAAALAAAIVFLPIADPQTVLETLSGRGSMGSRIAVAAVSLVTVVLACAAGAVWLNGARTRRVSKRIS